MLFDADVFAAVAVVVVNDRSTYELRAGKMGTRKEGLSFPSFLHVVFSTSSTCQSSATAYECGETTGD